MRNHTLKGGSLAIPKWLDKAILSAIDGFLDNLTDVFYRYFKYGRTKEPIGYSGYCLVNCCNSVFIS